MYRLILAAALAAQASFGATYVSADEFGDGVTCYRKTRLLLGPTVAIEPRR